MAFRQIDGQSCYAFLHKCEQEHVQAAMLSISFLSSLDPRTLIFSNTVSALMLSLMALVFGASGGARSHGFIQWAAANACAALALALIYLRSQLSPLLGIGLANVLLMAGVLLSLAAIHAYFDRPFPRRAVGLSVLLGLAGLAASFWAGASMVVATVAVCVALVFLQALCVRLAFMCAARPFSAGVWLYGLSTGAMAIVFGVRAVTVLLSGQVMDPASQGTQQLGTLLVGGMFIVVTSIGFFAMVHDDQLKTIEELGRRDGLTGLLVRRAFFDSAEKLEAAGTSYAILMIDIDHFKAINDRYGHGGGDRVLAHCARLMQGQLRIDDLLGRYGGEEFCALLPKCQAADVHAIAQTLVSKTAAQRIALPDGREVQVTISVRVSVMQPGQTLDAVIEQADQALYAAKNGGRNRVVLATGTMA